MGTILTADRPGQPLGVAHGQRVRLDAQRRERQLAQVLEQPVPDAGLVDLDSRGLSPTSWGACVAYRKSVTSRARRRPE